MKEPLRQESDQCAICNCSRWARCVGNCIHFIHKYIHIHTQAHTHTSTYTRCRWSDAHIWTNAWWCMVFVEESHLCNVHRRMHVPIALRMGKRLDGVVWYQLSLASLNHLLYSGWSHVLRLHKAFHMSGAGAYTCMLSTRGGWRCSSGEEAAHPTPIEPVRGISWNITYVSRFGTLYHAGSEWRADSFNKETTDRSDTLLELPHTIPLHSHSLLFRCSQCSDSNKSVPFYRFRAGAWSDVRIRNDSVTARCTLELGVSISQTVQNRPSSAWSFNSVFCLASGLPCKRTYVGRC